MNVYWSEMALQAEGQHRQFWLSVAAGFGTRFKGKFPKFYWASCQLKLACGFCERHQWCRGG
jgi:hypothetical protein